VWPRTGVSGDGVSGATGAYRRVRGPQTGAPTRKSINGRPVYLIVIKFRCVCGCPDGSGFQSKASKNSKAALSTHGGLALLGVVQPKAWVDPRLDD
jgi:hypothetical protein